MLKMLRRMCFFAYAFISRLAFDFNFLNTLLLKFCFCPSEIYVYISLWTFMAIKYFPAHRDFVHCFLSGKGTSGTGPSPYMVKRKSFTLCNKMGLRVEFLQDAYGCYLRTLFPWTSMVQGKICMPLKAFTREIKIFLKIISWYIST
jgi:hypothetical protein